MMLARLARMALLAVLGCCMVVAGPAGDKTLWKPVQFAVVRFNDEAPQSWNIYHSEKRDALLVKLWKRFLYLDLKEGEVYEVDPQTVKPQGDNVEWSLSDLPSEPIETSDWKIRDAGLMVRRVRFRFGKPATTWTLICPSSPTANPPIEST